MERLAVIKFMTDPGGECCTLQRCWPAAWLPRNTAKLLSIAGYRWPRASDEFGFTRSSTRFCYAFLHSQRILQPVYFTALPLWIDNFLSALHANRQNQNKMHANKIATKWPKS